MFLKRIFASGVLWFLSTGVTCAQVTINTGVHTDVPHIIAGIVNVLLLWSGMVATALFLLGAVMMVGSGGDESLLASGKKIMKSALIGLAIILSSWLILSTVVYLLAA